MNINNKSELEVLKFLTQICFTAHSTKDIAKNTKVSKSQIYNLLKILTKRNLIKQINKRYQANMSNYLTLSLRKTFDLDTIYQQKNSKKIIQEYESIQNKDIIAVLYTKKGDSYTLTHISQTVQPGSILKSDFDSKYLEGDKEIIDLLKNSLIIHDNNYITKFLKLQTK